MKLLSEVIANEDRSRQRIAALEAEHYNASMALGMLPGDITLAEACRDMKRERDEERARLDWFFGPARKEFWLDTYMRGVRENWTSDQWRVAIDAARNRHELGLIGPEKTGEPSCR